MIQGISFKNNFSDMPQVLPNASKQKTKKNSPIKSYADSFVKHAKQSTPPLLAMTGIWVVVDKITKKNTIIKSLASNLKGFFLPVLLVSSAILAVVENKKSSAKN